MTLPDPSIPVLSYDEAEIVGADLARCWVGLTGLDTVPSTETLTDLVQRVQRKSREIIASRTDVSEQRNGKMYVPERELPY